MKLIYKIVDWILLTIILIILILMYLRMPPTMGDIISAETPEAKQRLWHKYPVVRIGGSVDIGSIFGTVDVNVENEPLIVEIW